MKLGALYDMLKEVESRERDVEKAEKALAQGYRSEILVMKHKLANFDYHKKCLAEWRDFDLVGVELEV